MTTKDYVYLSLLVLSGVFFYFNGFFAGVSRARKLFERGMNDEEQMAEQSNETIVEPVELPALRRGHSNEVLSEPTTIRAVFGKN